jgi:predicted metal-dependent phosphoesterase TrpH
MIGEIHCHTRFSKPKLFHRNLPTPFELVDHAVELGLDFMAITDHDSQAAFAIVEEYALHKGLVLIPGAEVTTRSRRFSRKRIHILAYGVVEPVPSRRSIEETIANIHQQGGLAVIAHPFCSRFGKVLFLGHQAGDYAFDGVEIFNSDEEPLDNMRAKALSLVLDLPGYGGSDAHLLHNVGNTRIEVPIERTERWQDIVAAMREGKHQIVGQVYNHVGDRQSPLHIMAHAIRAPHEEKHEDTFHLN